MNDEIQNNNERPPIRIPQSAYVPLRQILELTDKSFVQLYQALLAAQPQSTQERFLDQIDESVPAVDRMTLRSIISELTELDDVCTTIELSVEEMADLITAAVSEDGSKEFEISDTDALRLKERLIKLLESPRALSLTSKASDLLTEHQHFFYSARLFSDMRPIFSTDARSIDAAIIMHNLVIHYGDSENHNDFHVAMDDADIQALKELLNRAEEKSLALQRMMKAAGVGFLPTND